MTNKIFLAGLAETRRMMAPLILAPVLTVVVIMSACSRSTPQQSESGSSATSTRSGPVSTNKNDYPVFPNADAGADPSVSAEQGGKGFTGEGWETNTDFDLIGDPRAIKGGVFRDSMAAFPNTLRLEGPESNSLLVSSTSGLAYETLLGLHPTSLEYIPSLATHWQVSEDKMTFRFRIDPNARFSDGKPVTSEDVVATYDFLMDKTLQSPLNEMTFGKMYRPVAESKYIVRVQAKDLNWRNFLYISTSMLIFPAHVLKTVNGEKYIKDYNHKQLPGTGPYVIREEDVVKGKSIVIRRRKDYWGEKARANIGSNNFDEIRYVVVRDDNLNFEMFKKGELDWFGVSSARRWAEETNFESIQRGLIQKRKVYNNNPRGIQGFALNTRRAPFNDLRVRKAFTLLLNRKLLIEKIMFNAYAPHNSYFVSSPYENPSNPRNEYNPGEALKLLAEAGWKDRDAQGRLVKAGQPLEVELLYNSKTWEPHLTVYQEDLRKVGINLNLRLVSPETDFSLINQRKFQMNLQAWTGQIFPNPESMWHSSMADPDNTVNITGFKNARVDEILGQYDKMFDLQERIRAVREIDGILANEHHYILHWYAPYIVPRLLYWNKFGMPESYLTRTGTYLGMLSLWWFDPDREAKLQQALRDPSLKLEMGKEDVTYWIEFAKKETASSTARREL